MEKGASEKLKKSTWGVLEEIPSADELFIAHELEVTKIKGSYVKLLGEKRPEDAVRTQEEGLLRVQRMYGGGNGGRGGGKIEEFAEHLVLVLNSVALGMLEAGGEGRGEGRKGEGENEEGKKVEGQVETPRSPTRPKGKGKRKAKNEERHAWNYGSGGNMKPPGDPMQVIGKIQRRMKAALFGSDIQKFFLQMDKDGSGSLDEEELRTIVRKVLKIPPIEVGNGDIHRLVELLDDDGGGDLGLEEVAEFVENGVKGVDTGDDHGAQKLEKRRISRAIGRGPKPQGEDEKEMGEHVDKAMSYLYKAELLTRVDTRLFLDEKRRLRLRGVAFNNFGYSMMRLGKYRQALKHLTTALHLSSAAKETNTNSASTHVNIAVVLGRMGKTREAAKHARHAIKSMKVGDVEEEKPESEGNDVAKKSVTTNKGNCSLLASAYFNLGFFEEKMRKLDLAEKHYKAAWVLVRSTEDAAEGSKKMFKEAWDDCKNQIQVIKRKQGGGEGGRLTPRAPAIGVKRGPGGAGGRRGKAMKDMKEGGTTENKTKDDAKNDAKGPHEDPQHEIWTAETVKMTDTVKIAEERGGGGEEGGATAADAAATGDKGNEIESAAVPAVPETPTAVNSSEIASQALSPTPFT